MPAIDTFLSLEEDSVNALVLLLNSMAVGDEEWDALVESVLSKMKNFYQNQELKRNQLNVGYFTNNDLTFLLNEYINSHGLKNVKNSSLIQSSVIKKLVEYAIVQDAPLIGPGVFALQKELFLVYLSQGCIDNIVFGTLWMIEKYKRSVPAVNVVLPSTEVHSGSGVLVRVMNDETGHRDFVITNLHVVKGNEIDEIKAGDYLYEVINDPVHCDFADLAAIEVSVDQSIPRFILDAAPNLLADIISIGYPKIPNTRDQYALFHRGEINGKIATVSNEDYLVISCHVNPGNSGGPIIDQIGRCAGIVTESNIGVYSATKGTGDRLVANPPSIYNMAIPPALLLKFLHQI